MRKLILLLVIPLMLFSASFAQTQSYSTFRKPSGFHKSMPVISKGVQKEYYYLSRKNPSLLQVTGPGVLRLLTRARFLPGLPESMKYEISYSVDGSPGKTLKTTSGRSLNAVFLNDTLGVPGKVLDFKIILGPGQHSLQFLLLKSACPVGVRYEFSQTRLKKREWVGVTPINDLEVVELVTRETPVTYYRFSKMDPFSVQIYGPVDLQIITRAEFNYAMKSAVHYRVQVMTDNQVTNTFQLATKPSGIATYKNETKMIPGKGNEFVVKVPAGKHKIKIVPLDQDKGSVLGRVLIPRKNLKPKK